MPAVCTRSGSPPTRPSHCSSTSGSAVAPARRAAPPVRRRLREADLQRLRLRPEAARDPAGWDREARARAVASASRSKATTGPAGRYCSRGALEGGRRRRRVGAPGLARLTVNVARTHHDDEGGRRLVYGGHTIGIALTQAVRALPQMVTVLAWHKLRPHRPGGHVRLRARRRAGRGRRPPAPPAPAPPCRRPHLSSREDGPRRTTSMDTTQSAQQHQLVELAREID